MDYKNFLKNHQQKIVLVIGYLLVAGLSFGLGRLTAFKYSVPEIKVEEASALPANNYTPATAGLQSNSNNSNQTGCEGKIKGTSSKIYHIPGQSGYDKLNATICFETEAAAQAAGFRKSLR